MTELPLNDRLVDLMLQREAEGLSADEARELATLRASADRTALAGLEETLDTMQRALDAELEPMPAELRERIVARAAATPRGAGDSRDVITKLRRRAAFGWLAAAAALVLAAVAWFTTRPTRFNVAKIEAAPHVHATLTSTNPVYAKAKVEAVWSDPLQQGYLRISGIDPNDPTQKQFQLWIIDEKRDKNPVSGGVFDVVASADGEMIIPINAQLRVSNPAAFAITEEKPGGVVVTAGPIQLLGKPE